MGKPKKLNFEVIDRSANPKPYEILKAIRKEYHNDIAEAEIALAWHVNVKADTDGHVMLGKCVKVSDLYKEFAEFDFIIVLNQFIWESPEFDDDRKRALLDHELCHAAVSEDEDGCQKRDERGRLVFRVRKHDIEEFGSVVKHHGCYKQDLEKFADLLIAKRKQPLFASDPNNKKKNDDLTVSVAVQNEQGEMETVIPPMPASEFNQMCDQIPAPTPYYELRNYLKAHMNDEIMRFPEGADPDECSRILEELKSEVVQ